MVEIPQAQLNLTASEAQTLAAVQQKPDTKNCKVISLGDPATISSNGIISFSIPGFSGTLSASMTISEFTNSDDYAWSGRLSNDLGNLLMVRKSGGVMGVISMNDHFWEIMPLSPGKATLRELDLSKQPSDECLSRVLETANEEISSLCETPTNSGAVIDILILFAQDLDTPASQSSWGNILGRLIVPVILQLSMNTALINSGITDISVRCHINAFSSFNFTYAPPGTSIANDLTTLSNSVSAATLRNSFGADLVCLITSIIYPDANGTSSLLQTNSDDKKAFSVVNAGKSVGPRFTFAHEQAHNLRCFHNNSSLSVCSRGFNFKGVTGVKHATIMDISSTGPNTFTPRIWNYSNPLVNFDGKPTGDSGHDNVKAIRTSAHPVSYYRVGGASVSINSLSTVCIEGSPITLTANVTPPPDWNYPCQPPYTYVWSMGPYPNSAIFLGNGQSINVDCSFFPLFSVTLRVVVTGSDGGTVTRNRIVNTEDCFDGAAEDRFSNQSNTKNKVWIQPNPANEVLEIKYKNDSNPLRKLEIFRVSGSMVYEKNTTDLDNPNDFSIDTRDLDSGIYFLHCKFANSVSTSRIVITH